MGKKRFEMDAKQLSFILVSMIALTILAFILGMQVGRLIKNVEGKPEAPPPNLSKKVMVSFRNASSFDNMTGKKGRVTPPVQKIEEKPAKPAEKEKDKPKEQPKDKSALKPAADKVLYIQVGAFKQKESVDAMAIRLKKLGMEYKIEEGKLSRALVVVKGGEEDRKAALERLKKEGITGIAVKR